MSATASLRVFVVVGLVIAALAYGCGRTSLDDGFGPSDAGNTGGAGVSLGTGGQAVTGTGGSAGGGQGGVGVGSIVPCGTSACVAGTESCCSRLAGGQATQTCVSAADPMGCAGGIVLCTSDVVCPKSTPSCCIQALGVGVCIPAGVPCMPLRP